MVMNINVMQLLDYGHAMDMGWRVVTVMQDGNNMVMVCFFDLADRLLELTILSVDFSFLIHM
jgi:hypothetical protein